ncbi:efflux RND transporter periplasmic adaptor subunit [Novosphingobium sp.]|uniref:efflux RND transporter periplasmic adaptor subunit n=1 Tax=Novosphingobium sp. TaxID=1874826 RepID=UPI003340FD54
MTSRAAATGTAADASTSSLAHSLSGPLVKDQVPMTPAHADEHGSPARGDDPQPAGVSRRLMVLVALAVLALLGGWYAIQRTLFPVAAPAADSGAQTVTVIVPGRATVQGTVTASGVLAARRDLPVGVAGEGGRVVQVLVDAGSWVNQGQVLAVIDRSVQAEEIASAAATVEVQQANARLAQSKLDRSLKLVANGFISRADIDSLTATRDGAMAQVRVARATLAQLRASAARLNVVAPAAGLVLTRQVEPGQIVSSGSGVLFRIARDGELEMQAKLSESNLARLAVGDPADVMPVGTTRHFTGHIWQLAPTIDTTSRQGAARIVLPYDAALRPGGFATATLQSGTTTAPVLPESAVLSDATGPFVYVVTAANTVERRTVVTGDVTASGITVRQGLSGTEHIVLRAGGFLNPGDKVRPQVDHSAPATAAPAAP